MHSASTRSSLTTSAVTNDFDLPREIVSKFLRRPVSLVLKSAIKVVKVAAITMAIMMLFAMIVGPVALIGMVDGSLFPIEVYSMLNQALGKPPLYHLDIVVSPADDYGITSLQEMRDLSFQLFDIKPEARQWMAGLALRSDDSHRFAGAFDPTTNRVTIVQSSPPVFLHEYAHANLHNQPPLEKLKFAVSLIYLWFDADPADHRASDLARADLARAAMVRQGALVYNPFQEAYANLAVWSDGDLQRLPSYLQPSFASYLQPGANQWIREAEESGSNRIVDSADPGGAAYP